MVQLSQSDLNFQCQEDLTLLLCGFATFCNYISATAFNISLVPQIHKNSYLKSTSGLSALWATALFTAALVHSFFIFHITDSIIYFKISSLIYCLSAFLILVQFWMYSKENIQFKVTLFGACVVVWIALLSVELAVPQPGSSAKLEWIAIVLFSADLLPQVMLNIMECSTLGQSNIAVVLMTVGKTFQFIPMQILETSAKFKSMIFVGAFLGHFNCLQLILYRKPQVQRSTVLNYGTESGKEQPDEESQRPIDFQRRHSTPRSDSSDKVQLTEGSEEEVPQVRITTWIGMIKRMAAWQILITLFEIGALVTLTAVTTTFIGFQWILFAPCVIFLILVGTALYRDYSCESCKCWEDTVYTVQYRLFGESAL